AGGTGLLDCSSTCGTTTALPVTVAAPTPSAASFAATGAPPKSRASDSSHDAPPNDANAARSCNRKRCLARKRSDSIAGPDTASASASSSYESPPNSRSRSASRCGRGSSSIARQSAARSARLIASARGSCRSDTVSSSLEDKGSRIRPRIRVQHSFLAIVASHAAGSRGSVPFKSARCADRNVCWVASSASARSRRSARQRPETVRAYVPYSAWVRAASNDSCGALVVTTSAVVVVAPVVVTLVVVLLQGERDRDGLTNERRRQREAGREVHRQRLALDVQRDRSDADG